jgi:uncharacterized caspase-like protein
MADGLEPTRKQATMYRRLVAWIDMPRSFCGALRRCAALAGYAALLCVWAATSGAAGNAKLALVIGNAAYENVPALRNPVNDATDMCAVLKRLGFTTLCHTDIRDRAEFDARVKDYVDELGPDTVGVFYYSGHGVQANNANFLIPTQVQPGAANEDPLGVLYGVDELFARLGEKPTRLQFVILDACRTDLFASQASEPSGRGTNVAADSSLIRALKVVPSVGTGLAPIKDAPAGTMVLYATASKDAAFDGDGRNGPLTKHVLEHIRTKGVPLQDFISRVTAGVENETTREYGKRQTPFIYGSFSGRFCFAGCPGEGRVPPMH